MTLFAFRGGQKLLRSGPPHRCFVSLQPFDGTSRKAPSLHDLLHVFHVLVSGLKRSLHVQCPLVQSHPQGASVICLLKRHTHTHIPPHTHTHTHTHTHVENCETRIKQKKAAGETPRGLQSSPRHLSVWRRVRTLQRSQFRHTCSQDLINPDRRPCILPIKPSSLKVSLC